jgi:hypothetical protein
VPKMDAPGWQLWARWRRRVEAESSVLGLGDGEKRQLARKRRAILHDERLTTAVFWMWVEPRARYDLEEWIANAIAMARMPGKIVRGSSE